METKQATMAEFLASAGITMKAVRAPGNPNMADQGPLEDAARDRMSHWRCTFKGPALTSDPTRTALILTTYFSQGSAHTKPPEAGDVLDCLASDACSVEQAQGFDDWAGDMGYNTDSRKAFKIYDACRKSARELKAFLGDDLYARLLFDTERL
jgi:hypothetical protein